MLTPFASTWSQSAVANGLLQVSQVSQVPGSKGASAQEGLAKKPPTLPDGGPIFTATKQLPTAAPTLTPIPDTNYEDQNIARERKALLAEVNALPATNRTPVPSSTATGAAGTMPEATYAQVDRKKGGKVVSSDGAFVVGVRADALSADGTIEVRKKADSQKNAKKTAGESRRFAYTYEIVATHAKESPGKAKGTPLDRLNKPAVLVWKIDPRVLASAGVSGFPLRAYVYDEKQRSWEEIPSAWDADSGQLIATTSLLGVTAVTDSFDVVNNYLPSIKNYETNLQSGTANVGFPIELPPGPGGFGPRVMLSYNSGSIDRVDISQQGPSSVGWGWTLSTNYIAATQRHYPDRLGCADDPDNPGYHPWIASIVMDGTNGDLIKGTDGYWHTEDEEFVRIVYHAGTNSSLGTVRTTDWWEAWDKNGTHYEFKSNALIEDRYNWAADPSLRTCDGSPDPYTTYRWMLTTATDVHSNTIQYTYKYEDRTRTLQATPIPNNRTQAVYPYQITWGASGDKLQATFSIVDRTIIQGGVPISDAIRTDEDGGIYQTRRVDGVQVKRLPVAGGAYSLLRAYNFEQDYSIVLTTTADPNVPHPHLTLTGIVPIGSDGVTRLPKTTLRYVKAGDPV
ncbi:MAG TPA: SpvB/TcaC N-terminal domain-containing protein, partial [Chloroflexia bacterium]